MSTDYLAVKSTMTVDEALASLKADYEEIEEDVYDVYVIDSQERLVGRVTIKELLTAPQEARVENIMDTNVIKVSTSTDQEEAAEKLSRYDLLFLPVVDKEDKLRGIITADDVIDVIKEEATEDIYQSSGISTARAETGETITYSVPLAFRARLPWLMVTVLIECGSSMVINHFSVVLKQTIAAASFMPPLSAVTGSVAVQSTCIVIRSAAAGHTSWKLAWRSLRHEIKVGIMLGAVCGLVTTLFCWLFNSHNSTLGLVVGLSLFLTMMIGILLGTLVPIIFDRLGKDPAYASGPLITSLLDISTVTIYLTIVHTFLSHLI
jgi:magnesium transporter